MMVSIFSDSDNDGIMNSTKNDSLISNSSRTDTETSVNSSAVFSPALLPRRARGWPKGVARNSFKKKKIEIVKKQKVVIVLILALIISLNLWYKSIMH
jgi:hypothetical protein